MHRWIHYHSWRLQLPLSEMDKLNRQKISRDIAGLNHTFSQLDIMDIYRLFHLTTDYTFFSGSHGTCTKIDHVLGHKTHINKSKRIEIIQCLLTDHDGIKLEINNEKNTGKTPRCKRFFKNNYCLIHMNQRRNLKIF